MKLLPTLLASSYGLERGKKNHMAAILSAHNRVRTGFTIPEMDAISRANERIINQVFNERSTEPLEIMVERAVNVTSNFAHQGATGVSGARTTCDGSFPTLDGSCNASMDRGRSMQAYKRLVSADYCNGQDSPRCGSAGQALPNERVISLAMKANTTPVLSDEVSYTFTAWGQFMSHDMVQTPNLSEISESPLPPCDCMGTNPDCKETTLVGDPVFNLNDLPCIALIRSAPQLGMSAAGTPVREQINTLSSYIDATTVYGFTTKHLNLLLAGDGMHLRMQSHNGNHLLPGVEMFTDPEIHEKFLADVLLNDDGHDSFVGGDTRVQENPILASLHTLFARFHNNAVNAIRKVNPGWDAARVMEEARFFVISVIKEIHYKEHLPHLVGTAGMAIANGMSRGKKNKGKKTRNDDGHVPPAQDDPSIRNEFGAAAYRFGHTMIPDVMSAFNTNNTPARSINLADNFFDPDLIFREGTGACLRGMANMEPTKVGGNSADTIINRLFKPKGMAHGLDLIAINLARGREHGLGTYHALRDWCMAHEDYAALYGGSAPTMQAGWDTIRMVYDSDVDIDLYVGLIMEMPIAGGQLGPTNSCIILDQKLALRDGDMFHHERAGVFMPAQLAELRTWTLAKTICNAMEGMGNIQDSVFLKPGTTSVISCSTTGNMNFAGWFDASAQTPNPNLPDPNAPMGDCIDKRGNVVRVPFGCNCKMAKKGKCPNGPCVDKNGNTITVPSGCTCKQARKGRCVGGPCFSKEGLEIMVPAGCSCKMARKNKCPPDAGMCRHKDGTIFAALCGDGKSNCKKAIKNKCPGICHNGNFANLMTITKPAGCKKCKQCPFS